MCRHHTVKDLNSSVFEELCILIDCLDFGDPDLIFKVTTVEKTENSGFGHICFL